MKYDILDWDTAFFGFKVAQILPQALNVAELKEILFELKAQSVELVYWAATDKYKDETIIENGGALVDEKTTFAMKLNESLHTMNVQSDNVQIHSVTSPDPVLDNLAIQCGQYSRFAMDTNFPKSKFEDLYKKWINNSLSRKIALEVLVINASQRVAAMVTLGEKNSRGDIGLLAVDSNFRGKRFGKTLVQEAQLWFQEKGYSEIQIVTQGANIPACNLYRSCGFSIEKTEYFYHFWL